MHPLLMLVLAAAPVVGPAVSPGTVVAAPAGSEAKRIRAASNGAQTAVVYLDQREAFPTVWAARLDAAQALTDAHDLKLDASSCGSPNVVAFTGAPQSFTFVWERDGALRLRRLSPAGGFLDATAQQLVPYPAFSPSLTGDPTSMYLVWTDTDINPKTLRFAHLDGAGNITGAVVDLHTGVVEEPRITASGTALLVTWSTGMSVRGLRLQLNGTPIDAAPLTLATTTGFALMAEVAACASGWFITLGEQSATAPLRGLLLGRTVGALTPPFNIATQVSFHSPVWDEANNRGVVFYNGPQNHLFATRVTPAGAVDPSPTELRNVGIDEVVATISSGLGVQLFWNESRLGGPDTDLFESRVTPALALVDAPGVNVVQTGSFQDEPRLATDGSGYLLVWQEHRAVTGWDVWAASVSSTGVLGAAVPLQVAPGAQIFPRVAFGGGVYLAGWVDDASGDSKFVRVSPAGQVLDATPFTMPGGGGWRPAIGGSGATFLVAYTGAGVKARRYTPGTGWVDPPIAVSTLDAQVDDVEGDGAGNWGLVYSDSSTGPLHTYLNRVTAAGLVRDGQGARVTLPSSDPYLPTIAWDGSRYLATWHDHRPPGTSGYLYGAHLDPGMGLLEPNGFQIGPSDASEQQSQAVVRLGDGVWTLWATNGNGIKWQGVFGGTISPAVDLVPPVSIFSPPNDLAATATSMLWTSLEMINGDRRVVVRPVTLAATGAVCADPWECHSGQCNAFVCAAAVVTDGGTPPVDAGTTTTPDAGTSTPDGGVTAAGPRHFGLGCSQAGGAPMLVMLAVLLFGRRSRSGRI